MKLPIIIENSKIPSYISKIFNLNVIAISFAIWIISAEKLSQKTKRHELIHYVQQKELYFLGQWAMYAYYYIKGLIKYKDRRRAYFQNPFEQEAYEHQNEISYFQKRKKYAWKQYEV